MRDEGFRRVILDGCGDIDPESIEAYIAAGGYAALPHELSDYKPEDVINRVEETGLLGRGGAGYPVASKWRATRESEGDPKFVIANAYDADPLSPTGRELLERMPHRVLEGMIIAAHAVGASEGIIYCRGENREAMRRARRAVVQAEARKLLGPNALGPGRHLNVRVAAGRSGFIGGEETAAIAAIEGRRAMPVQRPPYPTQHGLWGLPTLVNSAETLAIIPSLIGDKGSEARSTEAASAKVFSLAGNVRSEGLIEAPLGISVRHLVNLAGGTGSGNSEVKAIRVGGPTGACLPASGLDLPLDFESLREVGGHLGSGRIEILDASVCMVGFARDAMAFLQNEACGRCVPCRLGTKRMAGILEAITSGLGEGKDLEVLQDLSVNVSAGSICGFGIAAPCVVVSTLKHFRDEYLSHIEKKACPTGQCRPSRRYSYQRRAVL